ncbi:unnamed protein product [Oikopleura dioica]|uniref:G-protein coupled receptors family 1 profile domain-containing protein n=2 Tax=Oikopleura dioica TaxID=34765 RepID=E4X2N1_OIKDI|nr:unnamed protein product [Oikopleura dioica]
MSTVTESTLLFQRDITESSGDYNSDSNLMGEDLQTEKLILVVYSIIELVGIIGNLYVIIWSLVGSKKTLTKHLLGNVAFAHLIYLLCVPTLRNWKMFTFVVPKVDVELPFSPCDYVAPIETLTVSVVVLSFYALGIERFNSASRINKPYSSVPSHVIGRLLVIWLSSILLATPDILLSRVTNANIS